MTLALAARKRLPGWREMLERVLTAFGGNEETGAARVRAMPPTTSEQPVLVSTTKCHEARGRASSHVADAVICIQTTW